MPLISDNYKTEDSWDFEAMARDVSILLSDLQEELNLIAEEMDYARMKLIVHDFTAIRAKYFVEADNAKQPPH